MAAFGTNRVWLTTDWARHEHTADEYQSIHPRRWAEHHAGLARERVQSLEFASGTRLFAATSSVAHGLT